MKHESFENKRPEVSRNRGTMDDRNFPTALAMVTLVRERFRADIILQTGEIYKNVRYPGPRIGVTNTAHGRTEPIKMNQLVSVDFAFGSYRSPIITRLYPFFATDIELENLDTFWNKYRAFFVKETDIVDFHESGYFVRQTVNMIQYFDAANVLIGQIDFATKTVMWNISNMNVTGNLNVTGNVNITGQTVITGNTDITGNTAVTGGISATGEISSDIDVKSTGISLKGHVHPYQDDPTGPKNTGTPQ
ncbi:MAG: hypothetical protein OEY34_04140 [Cyclobacteriaceae bacterium]|nr:hypothetical protein [Cyclobacteriaceae bacterium]